MFTREAQTIIERAKDVATSWGATQLALNAITTSITLDHRGARLLAEALETEQAILRRLFPAPEILQQCQGKLTLAHEVRDMLGLAKECVKQVPSPGHPGLIALSHLVCAVAQSLPASQLPGLRLPSREQVLQCLVRWLEEELRPLSLGDLTRRLRALRHTLMERIYGQEHAIHQFVEGLFNVEVVGSADTTRQKPAGLFVFAGPPGVGKTYLAELGASCLDRPFQRFDMSAYAHSHETTSLIGTPRVYRDAQPGILTDFVQKNPNTVLLFDEIEKAHHTTIQLFLQVLNAGRPQDKFTEQDVAFRDTIMIFTTNVGRSLYDNQNATGVHQANAAFHRSTVLDALRTEIDPQTRAPFFPAAICSRLATGYPILFNHLRVDDLRRVAQAELTRVGALLERQHNQRYVLADEVPLAMVMREGASTDARTIKAQAEAFLKEEVFKACQLFADEHVDAALEELQEVSVELDAEHAGEVAQHLFWDNQRPALLFVGDRLLGQFYAGIMPQVDWHIAASTDQAFDVLTRQTVDFVLLDLAVPAAPPEPYADLAQAFHDVSVPFGADKTVLHFDYRPLAARQFVAGQQLLEQLHVRMPVLPVFLFSLEDDTTGRAVDAELLRACVRAGGARGVIRTMLGGSVLADWECQRDALCAEIEAVAKRLRMERMAAELVRQNQVVVFDTVPAMSADGKRLQVRCRNFWLVRAVRSADASGLISDVERPTTRFADVIGAAGAKEALTFIRDWLREPKKYAAAGVEPPRGVLLTGPPGTGKTMLARAWAGECEGAFLAESATNFVTMWQGSGPENVRHLFARARRYTPSIVFIDEIDAIGRKRTGSPGAGHGEEMALNALLTEMDGFARSMSQPVIVIAATNLVETLDPALLRRFSRVIDVELPTRAERECYLRQRLDAKQHHDVSAQMVERLAAQGPGMSIADLERVLAQATLMAVAHQGVITKSAEKPRHSCRGGIGVGRAGLNAQEPNKTHAVPEPSMGEGTAEREAPAFMPGRTSRHPCRGL